LARLFFASDLLDRAGVLLAAGVVFALSCWNSSADILLLAFCCCFGQVCQSLTDAVTESFFSFLLMAAHQQLL
jgi:hypothetical protein